MKAYQSDHQARYDKSSGIGRTCRETLFTLGFSLLLHQRTRKRNLIQTIARMSVGETYPRILHLEIQIAQAVIKRMEATSGICIPPFVIKNQSIYFAIDNVDFLEDTPTGKDTLHGTAMVMYQRQIPDRPTMIPSLAVDVNHKPLMTEKLNVPLLYCPAPLPAPVHIPNFKVGQNDLVSQSHKLNNLAWIMGCHDQFLYNTANDVPANDSVELVEETGRHFYR